MNAHHRRIGVAILLVACIGSGCSTQARRVDCEGRLEPINRPALKRPETPSSAPASPTTREPS